VVGDLEMDLITRKVTRAAKPVELTVREFELLEYLMRRPGAVVGKGELLREVWRDSGADLNAVEVYAGYLRRKLGRDVVETVRGVGYRLPRR
jgi:DNA-binding response OmpR family regulator